MEKKIKWGVLGYANIAKKAVIPAIMRSSNSELYAIASRNDEKLEKCKGELSCPKYYNSYEELLDDTEIDAVYIPLPNGLHKEWTIKAARRGKHVLCEKPIALNAEECLEMIDECRKNNVLLMEAFMYRYTHRTKKVREILESGLIGDVKYIYSSFRFPLKRKGDVRMDRNLGGGSIYDVGCYPINFVGMVMKSSPVSISGEFLMENDVDVIFSGTLKYDNGVLCSINCGFNAFERIYSEIVGTKGVMEIPLTFLDDGGFITVTTEEGKTQVEVEKSDRYKSEVEDFADAILEGRQPMFTLDETLQNMEVIDRLYKMVYEKQ